MDPGLQWSFETPGNLTPTESNILVDLNLLVKNTSEKNTLQTEVKGNVKDKFQSQQYESMKQICTPDISFVFHFAILKFKD